MIQNETFLTKNRHGVKMGTHLLLRVVMSACH